MNINRVRFEDENGIIWFGKKVSDIMFEISYVLNGELKEKYIGRYEYVHNFKTRKWIIV